MRKSPERQRKVRPRLSHEQGLDLVRRSLIESDPNRPTWHKGLGPSFEDWSKSPVSLPRLSFADTVVARRLEAEGPWWLLAEILGAQHQRTKSMIAAFDDADRRLAENQDNDFGRGAAIAVVGALHQHAHVPMRRTPTVDHLLNAIADAHHGIPNPFWHQPSERREGKPLAGAAEAEFTGELAGIIQVLATALGKSGLTEARSGRTGRPVRKLAEKRARQLGVDWTDSTTESFHARVIGPSRGKALDADPGLKFEWKRLAEVHIFNHSELGRYPRERCRFLEVIKAARNASARGEDMKAWCVRRAEIVFSLERSPAKTAD